MSAGSGPKFCLRWDGFRSRLSSVFEELRRDDELMDMTLCCDGGQTVRAHRILLSASSPCLRRLIKEHPCQHPVVFLKDTSAEDLAAVIEFVYRGEVNVSQTQLASFIKTAEMLQIQGLSGEGDAAPVRPQTPPAASSSREAPTAAPPPVPTGGPPPSKRPRPAADFPAAAGTAGTAGRSGTIKSEPVELSDDDADLEETLACLSNFEESGPVRPGPPADAADTPAAAATAASGASLQGHRLSWSRSGTIGAGLRKKDVFTVLDCEGLPQRTLTRPSSMRGVRRMSTVESGDSEILGLQSDYDSLFPPLTQDEITNPELDVQILPAHLLRRLDRHLPLSNVDWRELMQCVYGRYQPYDHLIRTARDWYVRMAESILEKFPFIIPHAERRDARNAVLRRLRNKFRNSRKPVNKKKSTHMDTPGTPASPGSPGRSDPRCSSEGKASGEEDADNTSIYQDNDGPATAGENSDCGEVVEPSGGDCYGAGQNFDAIFAMEQSEDEKAEPEQPRHERRKSV